MREGIIGGTKNRILQILARFLPGATSLRVVLHRWRGVKIGKGVWIGYDAVIETAYPHLVSIGDGVVIGLRSTIIAHNLGQRGVTIEDEVNIGLGVIILPNVTIGRGSVVTAGSVVTHSIPPMTMVQGNPAKPVAKCGIPLTDHTDLREFMKNLRRL